MARFYKSMWNRNRLQVFLENKIFHKNAATEGARKTKFFHTEKGKILNIYKNIL